MLRVRAAERATADPDLANVPGGLVDHLVAALDRLEDLGSGAHLESLKQSG